MSGGKGKARPTRTSKEAQIAGRHSELKAFLDQRNRDLQLIEAVLIAIRFAVDHECELDAADAVGGVVVLVGHVLHALGQIEVSPEVSDGQE